MITRLLIVAITLLAFVTGCGDKSEANGSGKKGDKKGHVVAVIPKGTTHSYWLAGHSGAAKAAKELDSVSIIWKGIDNDNDSNAQIDLVQDFIQQEVDAIALSPLDAAALANIVNTAYDKGVKVIIWDSDVNTEKRHSFIATDNYKGGELCADKIGELTGGKGKVVMIRYKQNSASTGARESGFIDRIKKKYPDIKLVSTEEYAESSVSVAKDKINDIFQLHGTDIDAIFCPALPVVQGVLKAVRERKLNGKVKLVGFDQDPELTEALANGDISALAVQDPFKMGELSVRYAKDLIDGKTVDKVVDTGVMLITKENMEKEDAKKLLTPDLSFIK